MTRKYNKNKTPGRTIQSKLYTPLPEERDEVERLAGLGFTQEEISLIIKVGESTLQRKYPKELRSGVLRADAAVLTNLFRMASGEGPEAGKTAIFWSKVRRRWHEVQRVIHGFDPEMLSSFIKQVVLILRRELPKKCPGCNTELALPSKIASQLVELSRQMIQRLPESEVAMMPRPELAGDHLDDPKAEDTA